MKQVLKMRNPAKTLAILCARQLRRPRPRQPGAKHLFLVLACLFCPLALPAQTCDPSMWKHVYHPQRLKVIQDCVTVTGKLVDATHGKKKDGARHEADGDTHAWLALDPAEQNLLLPGNTETQQGNMVFELVCYYRVTQADAKDACANYKTTVKLPPVGSRIAVTGALIEDLDHKPIHREIHPVTGIKVLDKLFGDP